MLKEWNREITKIVKLCDEQKEQCIKVEVFQKWVRISTFHVYYERLVQRPEIEMRRVLAFVDVPFSEDVLHHHEQIGKEVDLNSYESFIS